MKKPKILIVDDEKIIADVVAACLREHGLDADTANSGKEALEYVRKKAPDLVILDLWMPGIGGGEVLEQMKSDEKTKNIPVIILSAKISRESEVEALNKGADDYINKPYAPEEIVARVKAVLRRTGSDEEKKKEENILITGGAGFIGSHLAEKLIKKGHTVYILDDFSTGRKENLERIKDSGKLHVTTGSITDNVLLDNVMEKCDYVYHLAATVGVKNVVDKPLDTIMYETFGTEMVLKYAAAKGIRVLLTSTSEVYGKSEKVPFMEHDDIVLGAPDVNRWSYACAKLLDEFLGIAYYHERNLPVAIVRLFNVVGPRQVGQYGMVLPRFFKRAFANEPIQVYGDGEQKRCFTCVDEVVHILMKIAREKEAYGQVTNLGSDQETSINELAEKVKKITGSRSAIEHKPYEEYYGKNFQDIKRRVPDLKKLKKIAGVTPKRSIEDILQSLKEFYEENPEELRRI